MRSHTLAPTSICDLSHSLCWRPLTDLGHISSVTYVCHPLWFVCGHRKEILTSPLIPTLLYTNVKLGFQVTADGRVEDWMNVVLKEMRRTNRLITKEAVFFYCSGNKTRSVCLPAGEFATSLHFLKSLKKVNTEFHLFLLIPLWQYTALNNTFSFFFNTFNDPILWKRAINLKKRGWNGPFYKTFPSNRQKDLWWVCVRVQVLFWTALEKVIICHKILLRLMRW